MTSFYNDTYEYLSIFILLALLLLLVLFSVFFNLNGKYWQCSRCLYERQLEGDIHTRHSFLWNIYHHNFEKTLMGPNSIHLSHAFISQCFAVHMCPHFVSTFVWYMFVKTWRLRALTWVLTSYYFTIDIALVVSPLCMCNQFRELGGEGSCCKISRG